MKSVVGVDDLFGFLHGAWNVERVIEDRLVGNTSHFAGLSVFEGDGDGLVQRDEGKLSVAGRSLESASVRRYAFVEAGSAQVLFADGRSFHDLDLRTGRWDCIHHCGNDIYRGHFEVVNTDRWTVDWHVSGPRKQLSIANIYQRATHVL